MNNCPSFLLLTTTVFWEEVTNGGIKGLSAGGGLEMDLIGFKDNQFRMFGMDLDGNTSIMRGYAYGEAIVGVGAETENSRTASGTFLSKTERTTSVGFAGLGLSMKSEVNNFTRVNTTKLGISVGGVNFGTMLNFHFEIFIPLVIEISKPNK